MIDWVGRIEETPAYVKDSTNNFDNLSNLDINEKMRSHRLSYRVAKVMRNPSSPVESRPINEVSARFESEIDHIRTWYQCFQQLVKLHIVSNKKFLYEVAVCE